LPLRLTQLFLISDEVQQAHAVSLLNFVANQVDRCWLKGAEGDALHAVLCAAGLNIRWLLWAIARLGMPGLLLALFGAGSG
jgi:hypothetical protein